MSNINQIELNKEQLSEKIIQKWLILQKTIKEEITLEDVITSQQKNDFNNLKLYFKEYYTAKLDIRKTFDDILKLNQNDSDNLKELYVEDNVDKFLLHTCEPIKNLLFLFRNDYNYIIKLVSLIDDQDEEEEIESLAYLFCNQFYDNILIPNPEEEELLLLIYKLFVYEIAPMNAALVDNFLNESSFLGKFCSIYMTRQEFKAYLSMIINPLILSIENENEECLDMSLISIRDYIENNSKEKKNLSEISDYINLTEEKFEEFCENSLFNKIPKTKLTFKKSTKIEEELEAEIQGKNSSEKQEENKNKENNIDINKSNIIQLNNNEEYNEEYKEELNLQKINEKIRKEKDKDLKDFYLYQLEQINDDGDVFSNEGLLDVLKENCFSKNKALVNTYKRNFLFIQKQIDFLLQSLIDKISNIPYTIRCICKVIYVLISKKFQNLPKYLRNSFIGKFIFEKGIFPILNMENKNVLDFRIFNISTKNCLNEIVTVLYNAYKCILFNSNNDTEKTIFNYYLIEIIPILNKFYDKIIDIKLPKILDEFLSNEKMEIEEPMNSKIFSFNHEIMEENDNNINNKKISIKYHQTSYEYFKENKDEILHLQCICFSIQDILFIMSLINKNKKIFSDLKNFDFFQRTVERIHAEEYKLDSQINKEPTKVKFFLIFKDEKNTQIENLIVQKKMLGSTFIDGEQESELICKRIKFCIKTILKGLNLLNSKDFIYLNMASTSDRFLTILKFILEDIGELSEKINRIPLKWYGEYISNNKKFLDKSYQDNDFDQLYNEIYNEEQNILNELKLFSSIIITRDGMNLRCAEKILEKIKFDLKQIREAKKFLKIEKFVNNEEIEVCIKIKENEEAKGKNNKAKGNKSKKAKNEKEIDTSNMPAIIINESTNCEHKKESSSSNNTDTQESKSESSKLPFHCYSIKDFIDKFSNSSNKDKSNNFKDLVKLVKDDIINGNRKNLIYITFDNYMEIIKKKIKNGKTNKRLFENIKEEEIMKIVEKIEDHILRKIYKYVYPTIPLEIDVYFYNKTLCLDWVTPEQLDIKKLYMNQLGFAISCIRKIDKSKSVFDKLNCIKDAHTNINNTIKFSSGKKDDSGQDELTPIFQYIVIKAQPKTIFTDINYIKCFLGDSRLRGEEGFLVTQIESATSFILSLNQEQLKMDKDEFENKIKEAEKRHNIHLETKEIDQINNDL